MPWSWIVDLGPHWTFLMFVTDTLLVIRQWSGRRNAVRAQWSNGARAVWINEAAGEIQQAAGDTESPACASGPQQFSEPASSSSCRAVSLSSEPRYQSINQSIFYSVAYAWKSK